MNKKNFMLVGLVLVLAGVYVIYFTDWFRPKTIQISYTSRPFGSGARPGQLALRLSFGLDGDYELTEVKVVPLAALQANPLAQPVWHLVSDSSSDPISHFSYGENISGMDPAVEGTQPQPLQPGVTYRLFVAAGKVKGQHDFRIGVAPDHTATNR